MMNDTAPQRRAARIYPFFKKSRAEAAERQKGPGEESAALARCSAEEARALIDYETAVRFKVLPLGLMRVLGEEVLTCAAHTEQPAELAAALRFACGKTVRLAPAPPEVIERAIFRAYKGDEAHFEKGLSRIREKFLPGGEAPVLDFRSGSGDAAQFLTGLIDYALAHNASDIHLIPRHDGSALRLRIKGELLAHEGALCSLLLHRQLVTRLKILAGLNHTIREQPQDGAFSVAIAESRVYLRLSVLPTVHGEKAVLRILGNTDPLAYAALGLDENTSTFIEFALNKREGAVIFSGPTGSGKTSTLYAILAELVKRNLSVVSVEDPVEQHIPGAAQTSLRTEIGLDYPAALRSILRQDPDVIMVGEIRDKESAAIAYQAALTGHLVLSTVHARSVKEAGTRLIHLGLDALTLSQGTLLLLSQRLVPTLCPACKVPDLAGAAAAGADVYQPVGCASCDYSGYAGSALAAEALLPEEGCFNPAAWQSDFPEHRYRSLKATLEKLLLEGKITFKDYVSYLR